MTISVTRQVVHEGLSIEDSASAELDDELLPFELDGHGPAAQIAETLATLWASLPLTKSPRGTPPPKS
jgi:hypothetical protein